MRRYGNAPYRSEDFWVTARFASLAIYRRIGEMVDEDGNAPSLAGCKPAVQSSTLQARDKWMNG